MNRVDKILQNKKYKEHLERIENLEMMRVYCKHHMTHFMDVARIAYILNLEEESGIDKEMIYATALLHDIGRWKEYESGIDHALASQELSVEILQDCGFHKEEIKEIGDAIAHHRIKDNHPTVLSQYLYRADKLSRSCYSCKSIKACKKFANEEVPIFLY
ncbi:putative nucleotidyltransferase with HDIG domain [Alkalibaculum bacchi]|uniref:Putative nucleotidyltransferase with HDIG domain n=1 Tax=Alkalibaculum bacchi TaxID=645887 RepID=A0A366IAK6_9FIRM|nr:HD domain-containing protein [Alkalibaculum bacchi]RBP67346.1 putative nucleotidyltransferase with HDIG domain [Alkalibaculum bacchi]